MRLKFWSQPAKTKTHLEPVLAGAHIVALDPFRAVIEHAEAERGRLLAEPELTERQLGMLLAYGNIVRAALEATGMFPRSVLK